MVAEILRKRGRTWELVLQRGLRPQPKFQIPNSRSCGENESSNGKSLPGAKKFTVGNTVLLEGRNCQDGLQRELLIAKEQMVRLAGFEPATCCSGGNRSIHLSYRRPLRRSVPRAGAVVKRAVCVELQAVPTPVVLQE